ncbi:MAG: hypothetical protein ACI9AF_000997, partial [Granulosicoccus sp.]
FSESGAVRAEEKRWSPKTEGGVAGFGGRDLESSGFAKRVMFRFLNSKKHVRHILTCSIV